MKKYVIEREIPNAGDFTQDDLAQISNKSCSILNEMGSSRIEWLESYVTQDKIYCVYMAESEADVREHAEKGGFPANRISEVKNMLKPS